MTIPHTLYVSCAACGRKLGFVTRDGWHWHGPPARMMNRRRLICELPRGEASADEHVAPESNFRFRSVERAIGESTYRLWEYPYTCDSDACAVALGDEWTRGRSGPEYSVLPAGRTIS